ncbi:MAG: hypothetical protein GY792_16590 [Gammaproteobacteria bacterium]|nr:hypothetical protein [Gammaproteobacteria bacterium]
MQTTGTTSPPSPYVEKRIYDGFPGDDDSALMLKFHEVDWKLRPALVEQFMDERLCELGQRLIYLEQSDALPSALRKQIGDDIKERMLRA